MELLLNLVWLIIALGSVSLWRVWWRRGDAPSKREWVALATFLFLLFPVISLTDDLHEELAVAECATGTKHFLSCASHAVSHPSAHRHPGTHFAALQMRGFDVSFQESDLFQVHDDLAELWPVIPIASGRAPPHLRS